MLRITIIKFITGPPNFTTSVDTNIKNRSLKLIGKLYFFDDSPGILETFWTKDGEKINTKESGGKLLDISNDYSSLIITNVSPDDAGDYQLTAINAVGPSTSDVIVLGILISYFVYIILLHLCGICNLFRRCWKLSKHGKTQTRTCIIEF